MTQLTFGAFSDPDRACAYSRPVRPTCPIMILGHRTARAVSASARRVIVGWTTVFIGHAPDERDDIVGKLVCQISHPLDQRVRIATNLTRQLPPLA